ncbi:MAG TPA: hypothetical protein PLZ24_14335 [Flavobacteriales bacterium]|nr:hypothetical protein [Flavobacteriales bacterium]
MKADGSHIVIRTYRGIKTGIQTAICVQADDATMVDGIVSPKFSADQDFSVRLRGYNVNRIERAIADAGSNVIGIEGEIERSILCK